MRHFNIMEVLSFCFNLNYVRLTSHRLIPSPSPVPNGIRSYFSFSAVNIAIGNAVFRKFIADFQ
jgi:hypothetical protein